MGIQGRGMGIEGGDNGRRTMIGGLRYVIAYCTEYRGHYGKEVRRAGSCDDVNKESNSTKPVCMVYRK